MLLTNLFSLLVYDVFKLELYILIRFKLQHLIMLNQRRLELYIIGQDAYFDKKNQREYQKDSQHKPKVEIISVIVVDPYKLQKVLGYEV